MKFRIFYLFIFFFIIFISSCHDGIFYTLGNKVVKIDKKENSLVRNAVGKSLYYINGRYYFSGGINIFTKTNIKDDWKIKKLNLPKEYPYIRDIFYSGSGSELIILASSVTQSAIYSFNVDNEITSLLYRNSKQGLNFIKDSSGTSSDYLINAYDKNSGQYTVYQKNFSTEVSGLEKDRKFFNLVSFGGNFYIVSENALYKSSSFDSGYSKLTFPQTYKQQDGNTKNWEVDHFRYIYVGDIMGVGNDELFLAKRDEIYKINVSGNNIDLTSTRLLNNLSKELNSIYKFKDKYIIGTLVGFFEIKVTNSTTIEGQNPKESISDSSYYSSEFNSTPLLFIKEVNSFWFLSSSSEGLWRYDGGKNMFVRE